MSTSYSIYRFVKPTKHEVFGMICFLNEEKCKTYDAIQYAYADMPEADDDIVVIRCNVLLATYCIEKGKVTYVGGRNR